jgi:hypothetical protein
MIISAPTAPVPHWMTRYGSRDVVTSRHATANPITQNQCNVSVLPPDLAPAYSQFMAG